MSLGMQGMENDGHGMFYVSSITQHFGGINANKYVSVLPERRKLLPESVLYTCIHFKSPFVT